MSGKTRLPRICWDSCVFIAWFKRENDKPLGDIQLVLEEIERKKVHLLVSSLSYAEVLNTAKSHDTGEKFRRFVKRSTVSVIPVDARVAELGALFRERSIAEPTAPKLKAPDALIAATADLYEADALHSFDPDLRNVNGSDIVNGLSITAPCGIQGHRMLGGFEIQDDQDEEETTEEAT